MYTTHGHQIPGTPEDDKKPKTVMRCGGVRICSKCYSETKFVNAYICEMLAAFNIHDVTNTTESVVGKEESSIVAHARRELTLIGEEPEFIEKYLRVVQAFDDMGHSGGSYFAVLPIIDKLLKQYNLSPLTDDETEWVFHDKSIAGGNGVWQNIRNSEAFSNDAGQTYWLISEREIDHSRGPLHDTVHKETNENSNQ